jgi:AcrR family transcriptional regulator
MATTSQPSAPRRKRVPDDRMLDAACAEFAAAGFHAGNVDRVAAAAATTKATIYARFGSKAGLFRSALEREAGILRAGLLAAYDAEATGPLGGRLHGYVAAYFRFATERPTGFRLLFVRDADAAEELGAAMTEEITGRVAELVAAHHGARRPSDRHRLVAALVVGATHHGAGTMAAAGMAVEEAAAVTEGFLASALRGLRLDRA